MPSPLGHALAGAAAGWALAGPSPDAPATARREIWRLGALFGLLGMLPDIDLLFGGHRGPTHGLGVAIIAGVATAALTRRGRLGLAAGAAYATHILLDWLGSDTSAPIGLMALWPLSSEHYQSNAHFFYATARRYWLPGFWTQNLRAVGWELLILLPPAIAVLLMRLFQRQSRARIRQEDGSTGG